MKKQLAQIVAALDHAERRLESIAVGTPDDRWSRRNDSERWSVAECVAHLNITSEAYVPLMRKALEEARQLPPANAEYKRVFLGWLFGSLVGPMLTIGKIRLGRVKTPPNFVPTGDMPKNVILAEFKRLQMEISRMVKEGDGLALDKVLITSPFGGKIQYDCYSALVMIPRHQERHLDQAEEVWGS